MYKAKKKNRVVQIADEKISEYKKLGYSIYDMDGKAVYEPQDDKAKVATLEKENAELKKQIAALQGTAKTTKAKAPKSKSE